jgi:hypothetical protein
MDDLQERLRDAITASVDGAQPSSDVMTAVRRRHRRRLRRSSAAAAAVVAVVAVIGATVLAGAQPAPAHRPAARSTKPPAFTSIAIQNANTTNFVLNSRLNLVIAVEYLRVGSSASSAGLPAFPLSGGTTWVTVVVTGLPAYGPDYEVTAGECSHGRAVSLGEPESGKADPAGVLILQVSNVPVSFDSSRFWIQISSVTGQILAEIRGPIFPVTNGRLIAPGTSICRAA